MAHVVAVCLLSGQQRTTFAGCEYFVFWTHNGSHGLLMARRCNVANINLLRPKVRRPPQLVASFIARANSRRSRASRSAACALCDPVSETRCSFRRWITVMPVPPSAALLKCYCIACDFCHLRKSLNSSCCSRVLSGLGWAEDSTSALDPCSAGNAPIGARVPRCQHFWFVSRFVR